MNNTKKYLKNTLETGKYGEKVVLYHLKTEGYSLLKPNLRLKTGEIDILMAKNKVIYVVEVKSTRIYVKNGLDTGLDGMNPVFKVEPEDSFTKKKLRKLRLLAAELMTYEWVSGYDIQIIGFVVKVLVGRQGEVCKSLVRRLF